MSRKKLRSVNALTPAIRAEILKVLARAAISGDTTAAQIYLKEYNAASESGQDKALERLDKLIAEIDNLART